MLTLRSDIGMKRELSDLRPITPNTDLSPVGFPDRSKTMSELSKVSLCEHLRRASYRADTSPKRLYYLCATESVSQQ
jgi:hypothetical protein